MLTLVENLYIDPPRTVPPEDGLIWHLPAEPSLAWRMAFPKAIALAALLLAGACRQAAQAPAPDYRPEEAGTVDHAMCLLGFAAVPLREVSTGHHLVQATLNGEEGSFVLDTGANATVIDAAHAQHFGVSASGRFGGAVGVGGGGRANQVGIDSLRVGSVDIRQRRIVTTDLSQLLGVMSRVTGRTVYGIIGQDVLQEHRAIIDVARPMLYLMEADSDPAPVPAERCRSVDGEGESSPAEERGPSLE